MNRIPYTPEIGVTLCRVFGCKAVAVTRSSVLCMFEDTIPEAHESDGYWKSNSDKWVYMLTVNLNGLPWQESLATPEMDGGAKPAV